MNIRGLNNDENYITLDDQNELNEILNEVSKAKELQEAITRLEQFEIKISVSPQQIEN